MAEVGESLAGRAAVLECHSLSCAEIETWSGRRAEGSVLVEHMFKGGYPELHAAGLDPERFFSDYLATYLERDVRQVLQVRSLRDFDRFMRLLAARTGQLVSAHALAGDLGVSPNTVKSWFGVLEASNIVALLPPYFRNLGKRLVKTPKLYFLDTGLAAFLVGLRSPRDLRESAMLGAFFETHVYGQIARWYANRGKAAPLFFYRDHHGHEVDFVIPVGERLKLYECKWAEDPSPHPRAFVELERRLGADALLTRAIVTPVRGRRTLVPGVIAEDSVELGSLSE
jgi:hypothetical protein